MICRRGYYESEQETICCQAEVLSDIGLWDADADPYLRRIVAENLGTENNGRAGDVIVGYFKPLQEQFDGPAYEDEIYFMITNGLVVPDARVARPPSGSRSIWTWPIAKFKACCA